MAERRSNQKSDSALSTLPLSVIGCAITTSNADSRSVVTIRRRSAPTAYESRTLPRYTRGKDVIDVFSKPLDISVHRAGREVGPEHRDPRATREQQGEKHCGATKILGAFAERIDFEAVAIYRNFDRGVEQLDDENQHQHTDEQDFLYQRDGQPEGERHQDQREHDLLPECVLVAPRFEQPVARVARRVDQAPYPALALERAPILRRTSALG